MSDATIAAAASGCQASRFLRTKAFGFGLAASVWRMRCGGCGVEAAVRRLRCGGG